MDYDIISISYNNQAPIYDILEEVFINSVKKNTTANLKIIKKDAPLSVPGVRDWWTNNLQKAQMWSDVCQTIDKPTVFMDLDTLVRQDLADGFQGEMCITSISGKDWFNSGVIFVQPTDKVKNLFKKWYEKALWFYNNQRKLIEASKNHHGLHQTSFITLLKNKEVDVDLKILPGHIYNSPRRIWDEVNEETKVIHITSVLRKLLCPLFHTGPSPYKHIIREFLTYTNKKSCEGCKDSIYTKCKYRKDTKNKLKRKR